jgi:hypothetical protein
MGASSGAKPLTANTRPTAAAAKPSCAPRRSAKLLVLRGLLQHDPEKADGERPRERLCGPARRDQKRSDDQPAYCAMHRHEAANPERQDYEVEHSGDRSADERIIRIAPCHSVDRGVPLKPKRSTTLH